jgi:hypothetical protein
VGACQRSASAGARLLSCAVKACVRVDHLRLVPSPARSATARARRRQPHATRVQVQVNGERVHRRVRDSRRDAESARALLRDPLVHAAPRDRDASWAKR